MDGESFRGFKLEMADKELLPLLKDYQREALLLHQELDYPKMAQLLMLPMGTVRSRLNRARKALVKLRDGASP